MLVYIWQTVPLLCEAQRITKDVLNLVFFLIFPLTMLATLTNVEITVKLLWVVWSYLSPFFYLFYSSASFWFENRLKLDKVCFLEQENPHSSSFEN